VKAAHFDYTRARSLAHAVELLASGEGFVKLLAGGQTLGPMLNLRLVQPDLLVDVSKLTETNAWREEGGALLIGAGITHAAIEDGKLPGPTGAVLAQVAAGIAYRAVRNRGTIGGSLAHADPAADWLSALAALGAEIVLLGPAGERRVKVAELVKVPRLAKRARWGYYKFCRKAGDFAEAIGVVLHDPEREILRLVMGATNGAPIVLDFAAPGGLPETLDRTVLDGALDDHGFADDAYGKAVHLVAATRALAEARRQ